MNILYLGPYKDTEYKNICNNHISSLHDKNRVSILPIYLSNNQTQVNENILKIEKQTKLQEKKYSVVIQYAPVNYLFAFDKSIADKNVCIPIIEYPGLSKHRELSGFDKVLCDSKCDAELITKNLIYKSKKIKLFNYKGLEKDNADKVNFHHLNDQYKFYIFADDKSISYVNNIVLGFAIAFMSLRDCCLIVVSNNSQISQRISRYVDIISQKILYIKNHIKIIQQPGSDISDTFDTNIHASCDCLIDIRRSTNCGFNNFLAKEFNNSIISNENTDIFYEYYKTDNERIYSDLQMITLSQSLSEKIKNIAKTKPIYKQNNTPTIDQAI